MEQMVAIQEECLNKTTILAELMVYKLSPDPIALTECDHQPGDIEFEKNF